MKILLTGGGSGGHITPLLAVAQAFRRTNQAVTLYCVTERGSKFANLTKDSHLFDAQYTITAGKFRRYHGESWLIRLFDVRTNWLNLRDAVRVIIGFGQAVWLLGRLRPDAIFIKGGFVGVPVGLAAVLWRIPFITHDSDVLPGLANRLIGRWARFHATGMPAEFYKYDSATIRYTGVLVSEAYQPVTPKLQASYREQLKLPINAQVLTVTGGSLGAQRLNQAIARVAPDLLNQLPNLYIFHQVGKGNQAVYGDFKHDRLQVHEFFLNNLHVYTGAADLIVTRAGTTTVAELGVQGKAVIVVPNPYLTGGHQVKNAQFWAAQQAAVMVEEPDLQANPIAALQPVITRLLNQPAERGAIAHNLQKITINDAAERITQLMISLVQPGGSDVSTG